MVKVIAFDLGGVLVKLRGQQHMRSLFGEHVPDTEIWRRWLNAAAVREFESGRIGRDEFGRRVVQDLDVNVSPEEFLTGFARWIECPFTGAGDLVAAAGRSHRTALLSNIGELHWGDVQSMGLLDKFHHLFPSFLVGSVKPDAIYFRHVAATLEVEPEQVLFLDDVQLNVDGARAVGMQAYQVRGAAEAALVLQQFGVAPPTVLDGLDGLR